MKYLSIDIETTGLDENYCQILSVGAVLEDTKLKLANPPQFHAILLHDKIQGEPYALNLNKGIIESILKFQSAKTNEQRENVQAEMNAIFLPLEALVGQLAMFLEQNGVIQNRINVAGKNYLGFDQKFLNKLYGFKNLPFGRRVLDPAILFVDWENDQQLPDLTQCLTRAGVNKEVSHNALEDAMDVVTTLRTQY